MRWLWSRMRLRRRRLLGVTSRSSSSARNSRHCSRLSCLRRGEAQGLVAAGGAHVGELLAAADVHRDVLVLGRDADDHAGVDRRAGADEERAALLRVEQAVGDGLAGLPGDEAAGAAAAELALVGLVALKDAGHDALALGVGQKLVAVAEEPALRHEEGRLGAAADGQHLDELARREPSFSMTAPMYSLGTSTTTRSMGSHFLPSISRKSTRGGDDGELIALPAHGLYEDGEVHLAAAGHDEAVRGALQLAHAQGDVLERLAEQPLAYLAAGDELALAPGEGAVVHGEGHLHGGRAYLHELDGLHRSGAADGVADRDVADAAHGDDVAGAGLLYGHALQALELVHGHGLGPARRGSGSW